MLKASERNREKERVVERFFNRISRRYDLLNHVLSLGVDVSWRRELVSSVADSGCVLDLATGTGDVAKMLRESGANVFALDISMPMLKIAKRKGAAPYLVRGSSMALPFKDGSFSWITVAFGVRNFPDAFFSLKEMWRVLRKDGGVSILEFSLPRNPFLRVPYMLYFRYILPLVGRILSDGEAYKYLPESVMAFPKDREFVAIMEKAGFKDVRFWHLTFGIVALYVGRK